MRRNAFLLRGLAAGAALATACVLAPTAGAAPAPADRSPSAAAASVQRDLVLHAMQRDLGMTRKQAEQRMAAQAAARQQEITLRSRLGADLAGTWIDQATGRLVVAVSSPRRLAEVRATGAEAKLVTHSRATLDGIKAELDSLGAAAKSAVTGWHVDPATNAVVVTLRAGQAKPAALAGLARHGTAVRYEQTDGLPTTTADYLDGGDPIGGCSVGFNAFAGSTRFVLFAGHCGSAGWHQYGTGGNWVGPITNSNFPGDDFGLVRVDNTGYWWQGPWVDAYNGGFYNVAAWYWSAPPPGLVVCKSGKTTGLTCGYVRVTSESVNLNHAGTVVTVHQLTRHSACVEPGDSGGSNISWDGTGRTMAEGLTSGANMINNRCRGAYGQESISWFQPVGEAISAYGISLYTG